MLVNPVDADALVLPHQAINFHVADTHNYTQIFLWTMVTFKVNIMYFEHKTDWN